MDNSESLGEPSCKRQENGDACTGSDRPLKKARFAWQVKGKYHLKNDSNEVKSSIMSCDDPEAPGPSSQNSSSSSDLIGSTEQNLEILGDYLLKQDFNTLDSVITDTDKSLLHPCPAQLSEKLEYPIYVPSGHTFSRRDGTDQTVGVPMSMVTSNSYNEDQCMARWQARQMAKSFVDNTINRVLDSWTTVRLPNYMEDSEGFLALEVAEFINNLPVRNSIENEGILMAISAHGLQNNASSSDNENQDEDSPSKKEFSRSSSPTLERKQEESKDKLESDNPTHDFHMAWLFDEDRDNTSSSSYFRDVASPSYLNYSDNDQLQSSNTEYEDENAATNDFTSHFDFMDAAVSFAIQNKGLTSLGTDYG